MNRTIMAWMAAVTVAAFTYMAPGVYAANNAAKDSSRKANAAKQIDKTNADVKHLIGKDIKNPQGEKLGTVKDFLMDPDGHVSVAVVSHGGYMGVESKEVAVPFTALKWNQDKNFFTMNTTKEQLARAPAFNGRANVDERTYAEQVYRYFGVRPYWQAQDQGMMKQDQMKAPPQTQAQPKTEAMPKNEAQPQTEGQSQTR